MVYFANENCWISIQNNQQELAVVSAPPKVFLVYIHTFLSVDFFLSRKNISDFLKQKNLYLYRSYGFYAEKVEPDNALDQGQKKDDQMNEKHLISDFIKNIK